MMVNTFLYNISRIVRWILTLYGSFKTNTFIFQINTIWGHFPHRLLCFVHFFLPRLMTAIIRLKSSQLRFKLTTLQSIYEALPSLLYIYCCQAIQISKWLGIIQNSWHYQWWEELYKTKKPVSKMTPNSIGLKDGCVFVQTTVLILNSP